jgi:hypothetical protein
VPIMVRAHLAITNVNLNLPHQCYNTNDIEGRTAQPIYVGLT